MQERLRNAKEANERLKENLRQAKEEEVLSQRLAEQSDAQHKRLQVKSDQFEAENKHLQDKLEQFKAEKERLQADLAQAKAAVVMNSEYNQSTELHKEKAIQSSLEIELHYANNEKEKLQQAIKQQEEQISRLQNDLVLSKQWYCVRRFISFSCLH